MHHDVDENNINLDSSLGKKDEIDSIIRKFKSEYSKKDLLITESGIYLLLFLRC